jgi:hypothetical protein
MDRFHIVVGSYNRSRSFFDNFHKVKNYSDRDKVFFFECGNRLETIPDIPGMTVLYRRNWAGNYGSMLDYLKMIIDGVIEKPEYVFFMQEHYLDTEHYVNVDTIPEDYTINLDRWARTMTINVGCLYANRNGIYISIILPELLKHLPSSTSDRYPKTDTEAIGKVEFENYLFPGAGNFATKPDTFLDYFEGRESDLITGDGSFGFSVVWEERTGKILTDSGKLWVDDYNHISYGSIDDLHVIEAMRLKRYSTNWHQDIRWLYYYGYDLLCRINKNE